MIDVCVLDSSVGVKWFREEGGSDLAHGLLERRVAGGLVLVVDSLFYYEVTRAVTRSAPPKEAVTVWQDLTDYGLFEIRPDGDVVAAAAAARERLGCSLYDAFPAGIADLLDAPLYSADARAHGAHPRARIIG